MAQLAGQAGTDSAFRLRLAAMIAAERGCTTRGQLMDSAMQRVCSVALHLGSLTGLEAKLRQ